MTKLFGIDIAKVINTKITKAGGLAPGVLTKVTSGARTPGDLTGGTNPTETVHTFQGFLEAGQVRMPSTRVILSGTFITVLGASVLPIAEPTAKDKIEIEGETYEIKEVVDRDPAAATYVVRVER